MLKKFMNKPITWGASFKMAGVIMALYGVAIAYVLYWDALVGFVKKIRDKIKNLFGRNKNLEEKETY